MCLVIDVENPDEEKKFRNKHKNHKTIDVWKVYELYDGKLYPPCMGGKNVRAGWIKSNRKGKNPTKIEKSEEVVEKGIHVFLDADRSAEGFLNHITDVMVKCKARMNDLVATSEDGSQGVFMKIFLPKKEYDRAVR